MNASGHSQAQDRREQRRDAAMYVAAALVPLSLIAWLSRLWSVSLTAPLAYTGDTLAVLSQVKGWFESGAFFTNSALGAPGVSQFYDYPSSDGLNILLIRLLGLLGAGPGTAVNLFYLFGFAAVGLSTAFMARRLGLSRLPALAVAILFTVLPYHWMRGEGHLFLSMYWIVPLQVLVLAWIDSPHPPLVDRAAASRFPQRIRDPRSIAAIVISAAAAACGVYYLFFGCILFIVAGLRAALRDRDARVLLAVTLLILVSACVFAVQMAPTVIYDAQHGKNPIAGRRKTVESEVFGLRITQMLLPIAEHRLAPLGAARYRYVASSPDDFNESNMAALGVLGSLGFLLSLSALLFGWPRDRSGPDAVREDPVHVGLRWLGVLTAAAVLFGTVAGFGAVFANTVSSQIRAYNRISVFIALFSFLTLGILADRALRSRKGARWRLAAEIAAAVALLGVLDQTPDRLVDGIRASQKQYALDVAFGRRVQTALPQGAVVFQLTYLEYPESPPINGMQDYEPFRGYLHTTGLRWSYGAMKGRPDAAWQAETAHLPPADMVMRLRARGFTALWVQLNGYKNGGQAIRRTYSRLLGAPVVVRADQIAVWLLRRPA